MNPQRLNYFSAALCLVLFSILFVPACDRDPILPSNEDPLNVINPEFSITTEEVKVKKALFKFEISDWGNIKSLSLGILWDTIPIPDFGLSPKNEINQIGEEEIHISLHDLTPNTRYFVRPFLVTSKDTIYSNIQEIRTKNHWEQISLYPGGEVSGPAGFATNDGIGYFLGGFPFKTGFYSYNVALDEWTTIGTLPLSSGQGINELIAFQIDGIGYFGTGTDKDFVMTQSFSSFNPQTNEFLQLANFAGQARTAATGFELNGKGYIGLGNIKIGSTVSPANDFWVFDPDNPAWLFSGTFPGEARSYATSFVIEGKAYVGFGAHNGGWLNDLWRFDPSSPTPWRKMEPVDSPPPRFAAFSFVYNGEAYVGGGAEKNDLWKYNPNDGVEGSWTRLDDLPNAWAYSKGLILGDYAIVVGGDEGIPGIRSEKVWKYRFE